MRKMTINNLLEKIKIQAQSDESLETVKKAYELAYQAHQGQTRKSGEPYITHPLVVALYLAELKLDTTTIVAALLHDVCEDTTCSKEVIRKSFGEDVAFLVEGVTKLDKIRYKGTERSAESLRKMFLAVAEDIRVVLIKLLDRLHNVETLNSMAPEKQRRIALETMEIYAPLAYRLGIKELSGKLEDLAFPYVYPKEYEWLMKATKEKYEDWDNYVRGVKPKLAGVLIEEHISFLDIHARAKHYYSLYKKLLKNDMDINKITDIVALRVIVPTVEDCYSTLGVVHKTWRPVPGKIKDYIAMPKPNGYRSLHTTVFGPEERPIEIQMRTPEMHEEAEHGIAAHWAYSEFKRKNPAAYAKEQASFMNQRQFSWIRQLKEWQKEFEKPDEFLESLKIDFFKNRIFVLTPKGDVLDLPEGSTPIDFAYHVHTDVGNTAAGAKVNGKMVALDYVLKNRDVVEILTQKNKRPSSDWLGFIKSPQARKRIASFLKKKRQDEVFGKRTSEIVELSLTIKDRVGLLRDVTNVLAKQKINIKRVDTDTKNQTWAKITIQAPFKNRIQIERVMVRLKEVKGVEEVGYRLTS
ncbi:MAG: bifunctional (p)ppGpp synthetase/guanosine-3',5'-bis(diphosphate) 3'-pyrophosphohydrolase [Candidatus Sungiibacteriota bacterium]|uniref:Bifunctional (P)ppGpp synthetase/guanosine-3',5'-bis(Diphosphate) 3'-pyrophosphohydrolase n=1 Tax=Candidatus Sungiibacteriota bacterium TaxID=2750080 RepID=A0A7T5RJT1_9BACT|nr:MAG: bifunctional (p)ppGpp synthetase/guanosine-3',5'-bis(diphosphate) 3'-pyrophosphohydrolase [Candidatus Sungbacteria bacterium]